MGIGFQGTSCNAAVNLVISLLIMQYNETQFIRADQNFQERLEEIHKDDLHQVGEVQKVLEFMKQESTRSFVAPKSL